MTTYNTSSDAANTMIRAFLTKIGEEYLGHYFGAKQKDKTFKSMTMFFYLNVRIQIDLNLVCNRIFCITFDKPSAF